MNRKPIVAGQFYELGKDKLNKQIKECFLSKLGPGKLPGKRTKNIIGVIVPHAGYQFSGHAAAHAYKEIGETKIPDTYIIIGPSHSGNKTCISMQDWETPLGTAEVDKELGKILSEKIPANDEAHLPEHSIEVQIPFLQFISKDNKFKIMPVMVSDDKGYDEIAEIIKDAVKKAGKNVIIIASSDFTHYGYAYGYVPFTVNIKEKLRELDKGAINPIKELNPEKFLDYVKKKEATICGALPIAVLLKAIDAKKAKLLSYYTSGEITGEYGSAVGYASIAFY
jgi:AmmeMemoRadiSam system protein B